MIGARKTISLINPANSREFMYSSLRVSGVCAEISVGYMANARKHGWYGNHNSAIYSLKARCLGVTQS